MPLIVNSEQSLEKTFAAIRDEFHHYKFLEINIKKGIDRSLGFNAISHVWYDQLARELRDFDQLGWKCFCKLHFGVPILRAEDEEFRSFYDLAIKSSFSYEERVLAMKILPVTSLMTNTQFKKYCTDMQEFFLAESVRLEFPPEKK